MASDSLRLERHVEQFAGRFLMLETLRQHAQRQCLHLCKRLRLVGPVAEDTRQIGNFGDPPPVLFALDLDLEGHKGTLAPPLLPHKADAAGQKSPSGQLNAAEDAVAEFSKKGSPGRMLIRAEAERDRAALHALNVSAFDGPAEAALVDLLRDQAQPLISLIAEEEGAVVGHILFSPVRLAGHPVLRIMGLAPMAVAPSHQRRGIGSALVRAGLEQCRQLGVDAVFVLGHPDYYPRFGFSPAAARGIRSEYDVPDEVFMALELKVGSLGGKSGTVTYHEAFSAV